MMHRITLLIVLVIISSYKSIGQQQIVKIDTNLFISQNFIKENSKKFFKQYKPTFKERDDHFLITGFITEVSSTHVTHVTISSSILSDSSSKLLLVYEPEATTQVPDVNFKDKVSLLNKKLIFFLKQEDMSQQLKAAEADLLTASKTQLLFLRKKESLYKEALRKDKEITQLEAHIIRSIDDCHEIYQNIDFTTNLLKESTDVVYLKKKRLETLKKKAFKLTH